MKISPSFTVKLRAMTDLGFQTSIAEVSSLLGCDALSLGGSFLVFC